jgi:hypothetical protein
MRPPPATYSLTSIFDPAEDRKASKPGPSLDSSNPLSTFVVQLS